MIYRRTTPMDGVKALLFFYLPAFLVFGVYPEILFVLLMLVWGWGVIYCLCIMLEKLKPKQ